MTDVFDATRFSVRVLDKNSKQAKIDEAMKKFDPFSAEDLEKPIKKGTLCAALYVEDKKWYRARVAGYC